MRKIILFLSLILIFSIEVHAATPVLHYVLDDSGIENSIVIDQSGNNNHAQTDGELSDDGLKLDGIVNIPIEPFVDCKTYTWHAKIILKGNLPDIFRVASSFGSISMVGAGGSGMPRTFEYSVNDLINDVYEGSMYYNKSFLDYSVAYPYHYFTLVHNEENCVFYLDGEKMSPTPYGYKNEACATSLGYILSGENPYINLYCNNVEVAELKMFDEALTEAEVFGLVFPDASPFPEPTEAPTLIPEPTNAPTLEPETTEEPKPDNASGLLLYYDFDSENVVSNSGNYTIKDVSGNGYDAVSTEPVTPYFGEFELIDSEYKKGNAVCGAIKFPNEAFKNIGTSYTISFLGAYMNPGTRGYEMLRLGDNYYTTAWGSGMCRICSYYGNENSIIDYKEYFPHNDINMFTFVRDGDVQEMYFNGVKMSKMREYGVSSGLISEMAADSDKIFMLQNSYIDEFRLYNRALTEEEIKELLQAETVAKITTASWTDNQVSADVTLNLFNTFSYNCILAAYDEDFRLLTTASQPVTGGMYAGELKMVCNEKPAYLKLLAWDVSKPLAEAELFSVE